MQSVCDITSYRVHRARDHGVVVDGRKLLRSCQFKRVCTRVCVCVLEDEGEEKSGLRGDVVWKGEHGCGGVRRFTS